MNAPIPVPAALALPSAEAWREIFALLDTALELDPREHGAWLAALGPERAALAPWLEELLRTHADGADFLRDTATFALDRAAARTQPGRDQEIGPYRLLREIGQGGMATVWLAERADGLLTRRVALKLPHVSWGRGSFAERMARERAILASLTHPNIARLYDAGLAADGRPYLALEFVDGQPIDGYANARSLSVRQRIELIVQVARAVAYAHGQLVVHRDLKPSNILVDAEGQAHLLDFGVAKLIDPGADATEPSDATVAGGRALTPDYASPEQVRGDAIGTASDIYSLGVVLFELLAGDRPYRREKGLSALALAQAVADAELRRPSDVAVNPVVARQLRGDLDAIVGRALAAASRDRYATIDAFADDLERHLRGEPVLARPDAFAYRAGRWIRRNKGVTAIAAATVVAILGGAYAQVIVGIALGTGAALALWQRGRALAEADRARAALERAEQVTAFVASIFTQAVPRSGEGGSVTAVDLLQSAAQRVESDLLGQPEVAAELGALIGASLNELGEVKAGLAWLPRAVTLCERALGARHRLTLQARWRLVEAANSTGELWVSEQVLPTLLRDARALQQAEPALFVKALRSTAFVHTKRGREAEAMEALHEAVEIARLRLGESSEVALYTRAALSNTYRHFGRQRESLAAIEPALAIAREAFGALRPYPALLWVERAYADALSFNHRPRDAAVMLRQLLADQRSLDAGETERVRIVMTTLSHALVLGGHVDEAEALLAQAEAIHRGLGHGITDEGISLATNRAFACALAGRGEAALAHVARADAEAAGRSEATVAAASRAGARLLAQVAAGRFEDALAEAQRLADGGPGLSATLRARAMRCRAAVLRATGDLPAAEEALALALCSAEDGQCAALERGLVHVEAANLGRARDDADTAERHAAAAADAFRVGQVDGPVATQALASADARGPLET